MKYTYTARNNQGALEQGELDMPSERELADYLRMKGLLLTHAESKTQNEAQPQQKKMPLFARVKPAEKIFFTHNLQVMVRAGLSLATALKTLAEQTSNKAFRIILEDVSIYVSRGIALSDALAHHPKVFSDLFVNMVRAGEKSGKLEEVLEQLTIQIRKSNSLISKVRGALTYPIIVIVAMVGIGIAMMTFVIPKITAVFVESNAVLPLPTRVLIATSDFMVTNGIWIGIGFVIFIILFIRFIHTKKGKKMWHTFLLKLPVFSPILKKVNLAKFARTFSSLLKTDIPIVQAFHITATTMGNVCYRDVVETTAERVKKGVTVSTVIKEYPKLFSPLMAQMIAVGEETGTLDNILEELALFYEEDVDNTMSNLTTIIEPILMIILGLGVGAMAIAIIMPMYNLSEVI